MYGCGEIYPRLPDVCGILWGGSRRSGVGNAGPVTCKITNRSDDDLLPGKTFWLARYIQIGIEVTHGIIHPREGSAELLLNFIA